MAREERSRSPLLLWALHRRGGGSIKGEEIHIEMADKTANIATMCFFRVEFGLVFAARGSVGQERCTDQKKDGDFDHL